MRLLPVADVTAKSPVGDVPGLERLDPAGDARELGRAMSAAVSGAISGAPRYRSTWTMRAYASTVANAPPAAVARRRHSIELKSWRPGRHIPGSRTRARGRPRAPAGRGTRPCPAARTPPGGRSPGAECQSPRRAARPARRSPRSSRRGALPGDARARPRAPGRRRGPTRAVPDACESRCLGVTAARGPTAYAARCRPTGSLEVDRPLLDRDDMWECNDIGFVSLRERKIGSPARSPRPAVCCSRDALGPDDRCYDGLGRLHVHPRIHHSQCYGSIAPAVGGLAER